MTFSLDTSLLCVAQIIDGIFTADNNLHEWISANTRFQFWEALLATASNTDKEGTTSFVAYNSATWLGPLWHWSLSLYSSKASSRTSFMEYRHVIIKDIIRASIVVSSFVRGSSLWFLSSDPSSFDSLPSLYSYTSTRSKKFKSE